MSNNKTTNVVNFILPEKDAVKSYTTKTAIIDQCREKVITLRLQSIFSLVKYTAFFLDMPFTYVEALIKSRFAVDNINKLQPHEYDDVMHYLLDLQEDDSLVTVH